MLTIRDIREEDRDIFFKMETAVKPVCIQYLRSILKQP